MNDESLDDLIALYRQGARERTSPQLDGRVLAEAARAARRRRLGAWSVRLVTATAAALVLSLALYVVRTRPVAVSTAEPALPGLTDGSTRTYLQHMDVMPGASATRQYLMVEASATDGTL